MTFLDTSYREELDPDTEVWWEPSPKQAEFLSCPDFEVLYGGAAGGGKSDALLIDLWAVPYDGPYNPRHRALLFRRTFPELQDLIARSHELYPEVFPGIKYNKVDHIWTTPHGATLQFGHMQHNSDRYKYRGRAWNMIGFDELTLWPDDACYLYLLSRCRSTDRTLPRAMRATTNPDGPGQRWVMERFGITEDGGPSRVLKPVETEEWNAEKEVWELIERLRARTFIPAKLVDNAHLRGTGYRENLLMLHEDERDALLHGVWRGNLIKGAYYLKEMQQARKEGRICRVPHHNGTPVNTFWDLGHNDSTSICFHQQVQLENRFIRAYENGGEKLGFYADYIKRMAREHGYVYGTHYLPHDSEHETLAAEATAKAQLERLLPGETFVAVPRVDHLLNGINQTRNVFSTVFFDETECSDLVTALDHYRKVWDERQQVFTNRHVHDRYSNYADAFRQFGQGFAPAQKFIEPPNWRAKLKKTTRARAGGAMTA